jgi:glutathione S-transferase
MKLFFSPGACALASQIVMRELVMKFDLVKVDLGAKKYDGGDYYSINPKGYVPTLKLDSGETLTEGAVILQYLSDQAPDKKLFPKFGTLERYHAMEWLNFVATELHKGIGVLFALGTNDAAKKTVVDKLQPRFKYLEDHLAKTPYLLGKEFSIVDAYAFNVLGWTNFLKVDLSAYPNILGFMERVMGRPSVQAAREAEGLNQKH